LYFHLNYLGAPRHLLPPRFSLFCISILFFYIALPIALNPIKLKSITKIIAIIPTTNNIPLQLETELIAEVVAFTDIVWGVFILNSCFKKPEKAEYPINKKYMDMKMQQ